MKLNTLIRLPDGREGTIFYNSLDGCGGVWGQHLFEMPDGGFGDLPKPEFMLRDKDVQRLFSAECVGKYDFEVIEP